MLFRSYLIGLSTQLLADERVVIARAGWRAGMLGSTVSLLSGSLDGSVAAGVSTMFELSETSLISTGST